MRSPRSLLIIAAWIPAALFLDTWVSTAGQWVLGMLTTGLLVWLTALQPTLVR